MNRVATARDTFEAMRQALKDEAEVELLIGRTRPIDRDDYAAKLMPNLRATGEPRPGEKPVVVVATQTIEVGADFDFHAMFLEAASYAAIRQRLGRCNRLGRRDGARGAIVLVRAGAEDDPVYRNTIETTWSLLTSHAEQGEIDLGISSAPAATTPTELSMEGVAPPHSGGAGVARADQPAARGRTKRRRTSAWLPNAARGRASGLARRARERRRTRAARGGVGSLGCSSTLLARGDEPSVGDVPGVVGIVEQGQSCEDARHHRRRRRSDRGGGDARTARCARVRRRY